MVILNMALLNVFQIIVAVLLIISVLLQASEGGLSPVFGGGGEMYRSKQTIEKFLQYSTIVLSVVLAGTSIALLL